MAPARHDQLIRQRVRLLETRDTLLKLIVSLQEIRLLLNYAYRETKRCRLPWIRYRILNNITGETLAAYNQIQEMKSRHEREEILDRFCLGCIPDLYCELDGEGEDRFGDRTDAGNGH